MRTSFTSVAVLLAAIASPLSVFAADMPVKAPMYTKAPVVTWSWTGLYAGINAGVVWGRDQLTASPADPGTTAFWAGCTTAGACPFNYGQGNKTSGEIGLQLGYNWQAQTFVYGIETDFQWANVNSSSSVAQTNVGNGFVPFSGSESAKLNWYGTTRARLGVLAMPSLLVYGTGGVAYGSVSRSWNSTFVATGQIVNGSSRDTKIGWVLGAGVDWKVSNNWILGLEYLHMELGSSSFGATGFGSPGCTALNCNFNVDGGRFRTDSVRARLSYQFGGPILASY